MVFMNVVFQKYSQVINMHSLLYF